VTPLLVEDGSKPVRSRSRRQSPTRKAEPATISLDGVGA
jgi:hypothetical protein